MQEKKTDEQVKMERHTEELERRIVRFTNIDEVSFTHSFRGISITVGVGREYTGRFPEVDHLATHLARKMISREKKKKLAKNKGEQLWNQKSVDELKVKMLEPVGEENSGQSIMTPEETRKADQEHLQEEFGRKEPKPEAKPEVTKKQIIVDIESRGEKVDVSKSKEELLEQLMELEAKGIEPKE